MSEISDNIVLDACLIANTYIGDSEAPQSLKQLAEEFQRLIDEINRYGEILHCGKCHACLIDHGVLLIFKGSRVPKPIPDNDFRTIIDRGILVEDGKDYVFNRDYIVHRSSPAAQLALGINTANGTMVWKTKSRKTLKELTKKRNIPWG